MAAGPFEERQTFHWTIYVFLLLIFAALLWALDSTPQTGKHLWAPLAWILFAYLISVNVLFMRTTVDKHDLIAQFGYCVPLYWKRIPLETILHARVVEYRPIRNAGGWGIRFGNFEKERCRFLNCRGNRGVLLETTRLRWIIGSQQPEQLLAALERGMQLQRGTPASEVQ